MNEYKRTHFKKFCQSFEAAASDFFLVLQLSRVPKCLSSI